ncbi:MAG: glycosyltransferase family 4 protein [Verrucomicrobiota bacterium]|nr:glycosyltransferase family 4 protein [Verrucomicrobiota bacterium]
MQSTVPPIATGPIIALTHEFWPKRAGIAVYVEETARAAAELGLAIEVWAPAHPRLLERNYPFTVRPMPVHGTQSWADRLRLALHLRRNASTIRNATLWLPEPGPLRTYLYSSLLNLPQPRQYCITLHGSEFVRFNRKITYSYLLDNLLSHARRVGVVSRYVRDCVLDEYPDIAPQLRLTHGALRYDFEVVGTPTTPHEKPFITILAVGRVHPRKGYHLLLDAIARLPEASRNRCVVRLIGPKAREGYCEALIAQAKYNAINFHYLGEIPEASLGREYTQADLFALPSTEYLGSVEGFGLVALEAAAHGLPILGFNSGGIGDAVAHGHNGLLAPAGDIVQLSHYIDLLVHDTALRHRFATNSLSWVNQFSWKTVAEALFR